MSKARGLARNITARQARSYKRVTPNGIGVTAIAAVANGRRKRSRKSSEYAARYSATKALLKKGAGAKMKRLRGSAFKKSAQYKKMQAGLKAYKAKQGSSKKRYARNYTAKEMNLLHEKQMKAARKAKKAQAAAASAASAPVAASAPAKAKAKHRKMTAAAKKRLAVARAMRTKKKLGKAYGGRKSLVAKVGGRNYPTYLQRGKHGKPKKIPLYSILGAKSKKDLEKSVSSQSTSRERRLARGVIAAKKRRERKAAKLLRQGDAFTPNKTARAVSFESWSENMAKKRKKGKKRRTAAQIAATKKLVALNKRRRGGSKKAKKSGTHKRRYKRNWKKGSHVPKSVRAKMSRSHKARWAKKKRKSTGASKRKRKSGSKKKGFKKGYTRHKVKGRVRGAKRARLVKALNKRWGKKKRVHYYENRKRHHRRHYAANRRRRYRRNPDFLAQIKTVVEIGLVVTSGFVAHRGLSYLLNTYGLSKISAFQTDNGKLWGVVASDIATALVGIPLAAKVFPSQAAKIGAGMIVSTVHHLIMVALAQMNQPTAVSALAAYPDAEGRPVRNLATGEYLQTAGMGEYLQTSGFGEYLQTAGMQGLGAFQQAAAGMGAPMMQAAAGFGGGMMQAAAGTGEYIATGLRGIGDYEQAAAGLGAAGGAYIDEGIPPNTDYADYALTYAENMSGIGDIPLLPTTMPPVQGQSIADEPTGARAGIFEGGGGIFAGAA